MNLIIKDKNIEIAKEAKIASTMFSRMMGLMFKEKMEGYDALIIEPCNSIHTCFMKFPIHAIFVDKDNKILKIYHSIAPWRLTRMVFGARKVIELDSSVNIEGISVGDMVEVKCLN